MQNKRLLQCNSLSVVFVNMGINTILIVFSNN